jgi:type III secretion protein S
VFNNEAIQLTQQALWMVLMLSAPAVLAAAVVGLIIAFIQAATQLQEQTFQYAAKFFVIVVVLLLTASLMGSMLLTFSDRIFSGFAGMVHR